MEDLSGLDWSSKPTGVHPKPPVMNPSYSSLRPIPSPLNSGRSTPLSAQGSGNVAARPAPAKPAQDSFSNLVNFGAARAKQNLTLAERQAQLEAEKRKKEEEKRKQSEAQFGNGQFWDSLGSRGSSTSPALQSPPVSKPNASDDDDLFAAFNKDTKVDNASYYPPPDSRRSTPAIATPIDLSRPNAWASGTGTNGGAFAVEDDDPFELNETKPAPFTAPMPQNDDDDFLGDLGRPVEEVRRKHHAPQPEAGKPIEDDDSSSSDDLSPPAVQAPVERLPRVNKDPFDKAVAALVDYGFSPEDAVRGLVESGSGYNVQNAANWLLDDAHRKAKAKALGKSQGPPSSGSSSQPQSSSRPQRSTDKSPVRAEADLAKSAAAVGSSLFKTANSLWKTGQKNLQKAVADFQQDGDPSQPKWMRDAQLAQAQGSKATASSTDEALMLESGGRPQPRRTNSRPAEQRPEQRQQRPDPQPTSRRQSPALSSSSRASPVPRWQQQAPPTATFDAKSRLNQLAADDDAFSAYSSPNRRKKSPQPPAEPKMAEQEPDLLFNPQPSKPSQSLPQRLPSRPAQQAAKRPSPPTPRPSPRPARQIPHISPVALQTSNKHRLEGTAHFKRGDYAAAHSSYSSSLSAVPPTHPLAILLLTNRALTALKTGESKQAAEDAENALKLIGPGSGQGEVVAVKNESGQDENRDLKDLYGKALSRKAEALEQMEKWVDAGAVWQICVEGGHGGANAIKGRQRCQHALAPKPKPNPKPAAVKPRPKLSATASLGPTKSSEAVIRLREANQAAAKEDDEKFALSDQIDARISAWRDGKRDNLRALLGSLDNVLWENSGWKKVGLHELVMANKVKINYMKAIAKTHPDKLPRDANTEVQLIAGLVFSTLNESWDKFKAENGL
ncbi:hypothetical protein G7046_g1814 [Stylonectria norvegica]|nr:hypothetical protein G7046_g1814 [Stylonectria norvegica]